MPGEKTGDGVLQRALPVGLARRQFFKCGGAQRGVFSDGCDNAKLLSSLCRKLPNLTVQVEFF